MNWRIKPLDAILASAEKRSLARSLGAFQLMMLGVGAILTAVDLAGVVHEIGTLKPHFAEQPTIKGLPKGEEPALGGEARQAEDLPAGHIAVPQHQDEKDREVDGEINQGGRSRWLKER